MEVNNHYSYDYKNRLPAIDEYLNASGDEYAEKESIPARNDLTFSNGFYLECYAIFVDIRDSSELPEKHRKNVLAKIYRSYISELTAIMQSYTNCKEVNIVGDCVSGIFSTEGDAPVMQVLYAASYINSMVNILNFKLSRKNYANIKIGIGIAKGSTLMIKAGYKGSGLNDVVWMGDVVNKASNLCNIANKDRHNTQVMVISNDVYNDLDGQYGGIRGDKLIQDWFIPVYNEKYNDSYTGGTVIISLNEWLENEMSKLKYD